MFVQAVADVELSHCVFHNNTAVLGGATFIINKNFPFKMQNCTFVRNEATGRAGALFFNNTSVDISGGEFSYNKSPEGGAIYFRGEIYTLNMINCKLFENNNAAKFEQSKIASAILVFSGQMAFISSTQFYNNSGAGGMYLRSSAGEIHNCVFLKNTGIAAGALVISRNTAYILITNTTFIENKPGALLFYNNKILIQSCHFGATLPFPVTLATAKSIELRLYNNVFTKPQRLLPGQMHFFPCQGQNLQGGTIYIWNTSYQDKFHIDKKGLDNQSGEMFVLNAKHKANLTQVSSQFASGEFCHTARMQF